jgi:phospholipid transport system transporter-binding protein
VIRRDGDSLVFDGPLTLDTVPELARAAEDHLRQGARILDFRGVTDVDSAAVALALEWLRRAEGGERGLKLANLPVAMQNLAKLYGVFELLQSASS